MPNKFRNNPRPLWFALAAMILLCTILLAGCLLTEKENTLLKNSRSEQFLTLAAAEADAAAAGWKEGVSTAELYHRIASAAEYLSMAAPTEENRNLTKELRQAGAMLLRGEMLTAETASSLETLAGAVFACGAVPETDGAADDPEDENTMPWANLPCITRREGLTIAETMTECQNTLHPAAGRNFIYTCRNVYVKLSQHGGVPLEMAVYTPVKWEPSYPPEVCARRSSRFLEPLLPRVLLTKEPLDSTEENSCLRFRYPCGDRQVRVDVRTDTGRIVGVQMLSDPVNEKISPAEKTLS